MDCIFCKILSGEIPSYKVYEDAHVYAFLDITQGTKGHTLVIPKTHVKNVYEIDEATIANVFKAVPQIARAIKTAFNPIGLNIINNTDKPLQSVFHFHVHIVPRYDDDGMTLTTQNNQQHYTNDDYQAVAKAIETALE